MQDVQSLTTETLRSLAYTSMFVHQDEAEIPEMMEEEEALADADAGAAPIVLQLQTPMLMPPSPSPLQQTQGQEEASVLHDSTMSTEQQFCDLC